jgi:hypothetical protein
MKARNRLVVSRSPRRIRVAGGMLVLPPVGLLDLPPDGAVGNFMGIAALRFDTPVGLVAVFLHDLGDGDVDRILDAQRSEAEAQLGVNYARRALWWERP